LIAAALFALALLAPVDVDADHDVDADIHAHRWRVVGFPLASLNADEGAGGGFILALYHQQGGISPFRDDISVRVHMTSRLVHRHELRWEGIEVLDLPLRAWARVGFFSTVTQTYCGVGNAVTCDDDDVLAGRTVRDDDAHTYATRFVQPHADALLRWRVATFDRGEDPKARVELFGGWRGSEHIPGAFDLERGFIAGPYPGSLYASHFPDGEPGFSSVLQAGVAVDARDFEPWPKQGWFLEASVRGASPLWGSAFDHRGANAALSSYALVLRAPDVVVANRFLVDVIDGNAPTEELALTGGVRGNAAFGGQWIGRGVRDHRYIGKIKVIDQLELRSDLAVVEVFGARLDFGTSMFVDAGWIAADWNDVGGDPGRVLVGVGVGLMILLDRSILMRVDVAGSPNESTGPAVYTPVKYPF
jgi:hypothetical protein